MIALLISLLAQAATPAPTLEDIERVQAHAQPVVNRYYAAARDCGARPPFKPKIEVAASDGIIHYDQPTGHLVVYPWSVIGGEIKASTIARAVGGGLDPQALYEDTFNDLLVAHELGHWLQGFQPERRTEDGKFDNWFAEQNANRLMVAFWREHSNSRIWAEARLRSYAGNETINPLPPPAGTSIETFFTADTMKIVRAGAYGWYQALQTRRALEERPEPTL